MPAKWIVAVSSMALMASAADAARTFNFSYLLIQGGLFYGNVNFTTGDDLIDVNGRKALLVTGISGDEDGVAITGLAPSFPEQDGGADNYLFPDGALFTFFGVSFSLANGRYGNFFHDEEDVFHGLYRASANDLAGEVNPETAKIFNPMFVETTAVPEPASWALMIGGFCAVGAALRHRRRTSISYRANIGLQT